ncbi:MAG TPA: hypothetical protein VEB21_19595, partial [Terriglobales bacterium]|nr:hypothetical protein [Terriglobales bacterium]
MSRQDHLKVLEIDAADVGQYPDAIDRILDHQLFGVLVRGVFQADQLAEVVRRIDQNALLPCFIADTFAGRTYGRVLRMANGRLDEYF